MVRIDTFAMPGKGTFSADQIAFINQVLDYLGRKGYMETGALLEQPFTDLHYRGPYGLFPDRHVDRIVSIIDTINGKAVAV